MNPVKYILLFFFIILLVVFHTSASPMFKNLSFVFVAMVVTSIISIGKGTIHIPFLIAILGGLLLDIYSLFPVGVFFITFIIVLYISYVLILPRLRLSSIITIFIAAALIGLIYQAILTLVGYIYYFLGLSEIHIILDKFYFLNIVWFVIVNSLFITIVLWIFFLFTQRIRE